ncbi:hypothetical protein BN1263270046 [Stenotrophomonas thermophila]|nr:hypothetical protein BN1263270046 [Stenotrophomonas maltophilia]
MAGHPERLLGFRELILSIRMKR